jgi:class 3 adenylate cyclase
MVLLLFGYAASAAHQTPLVVSSDPQFAQKIFDYLQVLPSNGEDFAPSQIGSGELDSRFQDISSSVRLFSSNTHVWYRIVLQNPHQSSLDFVLFNHINIFSLFIVQRTNTIKIGEIGFGTNVYNDQGVVLPAHAITVPPGESVLYLGLNTNRHPITLNFELHAKDSFQKYHTSRLIFVSGLMTAMVAIFIYNLFLFFIFRNRLYFYYLIAVAGLVTLQSIITGGLGLLGPTVPFNIGHVWIYSLCACLIGVGLFILEYFDVSRNNFPRLRTSMFTAIALCILSSLGFVVIWPIAVPVLVIALIGITVISIVLMLQIYKSESEKVWLFVVAFFPAVFSGIVYGIAHTFSGQSDFYNNVLNISCFFNAYALSFLINQKINGINKARENLEASLKSIIPPVQLSKVIRDNLSIESKPNLHYVTIMFIDIVGYSIATRRQGPTESFHMIKNVLQQITKIVLQHGGIIDKSLGDGCLCFFGYDMAGGTVEGHELAALRCALDIQRRSVEAIIRRDSSIANTVFPLRIGINSAEVCIGNMGDANRFDFTMIGEGVIMANRFETACEPFKIILGRKTFDAVKDRVYQQEVFYSRLVPIKHEGPLVESFEVNPFEKDPSALDLAREIYWRSINVEPRFERLQVSGSQVVFATDYGDMKLFNFSRDGFCLESRTFLGRNIELLLDLSSRVDDPFAKLVSPISSRIVWGAPNRDGVYMLGAKIIGLSQDKRIQLFEMLKKACAIDD